MKGSDRLIGCILLILALACGSCTKDSDLQDQERFTKIYGAEGGSSLRKVWEMPNGDLMMVGQMSYSGYSNAIGGGDNFGSLQETGMALIHTDSKGNVITQRSYPISDLDLAPGFELTDIDGLSTLIDIWPTPDGGFFALGQFQGFGFTINGNVAAPSQSNVSPFIAYFDSELSLTKLHSLNGTAPWDGLFHVAPVIKEKPGGGYMMLLGINVENFTNIIGYQLLELDEYGRISSTHEYFSTGFRFARDFDFNPDGDIVVFGGVGFDNLHVFTVSGSTFQEVSVDYVDDDGVFGSWNNNPLFIHAHADNTYTLVYPNPTHRTNILFLDNNFKRLAEPIDYEPNLSDQYPVKTYRARNGDFLIINNDISQEQNTGYLYRLTSTGKTIYRKYFDGLVRDVIETRDGDLLVLADIPYNQLIYRGTLFKLSPDGNLY